MSQSQNHKNDPSYNGAPEGYGMSVDDLLFLNRLVTQTIKGRLEAGHHPEDVVLTAWDFYDNAVRALLNGTYPKNGPLGIDLADELEDKKDENMILNYELAAQGEYIKQLESICAPSKLAKIKIDQDPTA